MTAHPVTAGASVRDSGVDWLTATCNTRWRLLALRDLAVRMGAKLARAGYDVRDSKRLGYTGWTVGQLTYGERQDGAMCVLSGAAVARGGAPRVERHPAGRAGNCGRPGRRRCPGRAPRTRSDRASAAARAP